MDKADVLRKMTKHGVIPVVRAASGEEALRMIDGLVEGGIDVVELTMTVPRAAFLMDDLAKRFGADVLLGAGTVLDAETARTCLLAGAAFVVSPATDEATIRCARTYGAPMIAGALTPTEIMHAWKAGADMIKVFPCSAVGGPAYIKSLKSPLPQLDLIATGGVSLDNVGAFLRAGATAVGAGADLVDPPSGARDRARRYLEAVAAARAR